MAWSWDAATPRERAVFVRQHYYTCQKPLSIDTLCELFGLTEAGLIAIARGDDWRPEYEKYDAALNEKPPAAFATGGKVRRVSASGR